MMIFKKDITDAAEPLELKAGFQHADLSASADFFAYADFSAYPHRNLRHNADC